MLFKDKLKQLRKEKNISQYDLANDLNISRSVIAKWETGLVLPGEESILLLMNYFNVSKEDLLGDKETEKIVVNKNVSISKLKKIIISLTSIFLIVIIALAIVVSVGLKKEETDDNKKLFEEDKYTLVVNNKIVYSFDYPKKTENESDEFKKTFSLKNVELDRKDTIRIYKNGAECTPTDLNYYYPNGKGTTEPNGGFYLWEEGSYNIYLTDYLTDKYRGNVPGGISIDIEYTGSIYTDVKLYFVNNLQTPITLMQIDKETNTNFTQFLYDWYAKDITLEEGTKIYFFATNVNNFIKQITGFESDSRFEEIYDDELKMYYIYVKKTCKLNYLLLSNNGGLMTLRYSE